MDTTQPRRKNVNLAKEREDIRRAWDTARDEYVALRTAAAIVFHDIYEGTVTDLSLDDYEHSLDILAAALSRLIPIYADASVRGQPAALTVDLSRQRFQKGATEVTTLAGPVHDRLLVTRSSVPEAMSAIKRADLPFAWRKQP